MSAKAFRFAVEQKSIIKFKELYSKWFYCIKFILSIGSEIIASPYILSI
jgi:hypothetical protein